MLEVLALLQSRHRWSGQDLAQRLEISERTLRRDVDRLRSLGYPVHAERGLDGGYRLGPGARLPPLLVSGDEAVAIAVGLKHTARQPITGIADAAVRALTKIVSILPTEARQQIESTASSIEVLPGPEADISLDTLTALAGAGRDSERVRFAYRDGQGNDTERSVEPHHLVPLGRRWYLVAWDLDRDDWRTFRLDRITDVHVTKRSFEPRPLPAPDAATFVTRRLASLPIVHEIEVVVAAPLEVVEPHLGPWGQAVAAGLDGSAVSDSSVAPDGSAVSDSSELSGSSGATRITLQVADLSWAVLILTGIDADIVSVDHPELRSLLQRLATRFAAV
jgi:predicted DNA-binding transcriptional regulator YafY